MSQAGSFGSGGGGGGGFGPVNIITIIGPTTYNVLPTDQFILCQTAVGAITINLPSPTTTLGRLLVVKDIGDASLHNIIINPGVNSLENGTLLTMNTELETLSLVFDENEEWWVW